MPVLEGLPADWQGPATALFVIAVVVFGAWAKVFGNKEAAAPPKVQEFALTGQLADMSPVKQLIEQTGLLVQQQVRTNINLEAVAKAMERVADAYTAHLASEEREREIEEEVERRVRERGK